MAALVLALFAKFQEWCDSRKLRHRQQLVSRECAPECLAVVGLEHRLLNLVLIGSVPV